MRWFRFGRAGAPRRSLWQHLLRGAVVAGVVLAAVLVTFPWWLPTAPLRRWLCEQMTEQTGMAARIGRVELSWAEGIVVHELELADPAGGEEPLLSVARLRMPLSPWGIAARRRVGWLEVDRPRVAVRFDAAGQCNASVLRRLEFDVEADRIRVRDGRVTVQPPPGRGRPVRLGISRMDIVNAADGQPRRVTLSGRLEQASRPAPVSLRAAAAGSAAGAWLNLRFDGVNLDALGVPSLLGVPLEALRGRARGSLVVRVSNRGLVDEIDVKVEARRLEAVAPGGGALPVIDNAGVRVRAALDPLAGGWGQMDVRSFALKVPGVDVQGRARVLLPAERWEQVRSLHCRGRVAPSTAAALLRGSELLPGGWSTTGPVEAKIDAGWENGALVWDLRLDGTDAAVRRGERLAKPVGRTLTCAVRKARWDRRTGAWEIGRAEACLGTNQFTASGRAADAAALRRAWEAAEPAAWLEALTEVRASVTWRVDDFEALRDVLGAQPLGAALPGGAAGVLEGSASVDSSRPQHLHATLRSPRGRALSLGGLRKPADVALHAEVLGRLDPSALRLGGVECEVSLGAADGGPGAARLIVDEASVRFGGAGLSAAGGFEVRGIERWLAHFPAAGTWSDALGGGATGTVALGLHAGGELTVQASLDARGLTVDTPAWRKDAGEAATAKLSYARGRAGSGEQHLVAELATRGARLTASADAPPPADDEAPADAAWRATAHLEADDAARVAAASAVLAEALGAVRPSGPMEWDLRAWPHGKGLAGALRWDATAAAVAVASDAAGGEQRHVKAPGTPLTLSARWGATWDRDDKVATLRLAEGSVTLGTSLLRLRDGEAVLAGEGDASLLALGEGLALRRCEAAFEAETSFDAPLRQAAGDLAAALDAFQVSGRVRLAGALRGDAQAVEASVRVVADDLAAARIGPFDLIQEPGRDEPLLRRAVWRAGQPEDPREVLDALRAAHEPPAGTSDAAPTAHSPADGADAGGAPAPAQARIELRRLPRCAKPAGMPARFAGTIRWPVGTRRLELRDVTAEVGPLQAKGSVAVRLPAARGAGGRPADASDGAARLETADVSVRLDRLEHAARLVPAAGPLRLAGGASAELSYAAGAARPLRRADVSFNACRGRACGQDFRLSGQATVIGGGREDEDVVLEAVRTDGLELEAGRSHAWLVADVRDPLQRPTGRVHLLAERLDDRELVDWLDAVSGAGVHRGPRAAEDVEKLAAQALRALRRWAARAQLQAKVRIDRLHAWDPSIEMYSDVNHLAGRLAARNGQISMAYRGGLNGGCLRCRMSTVLGDPDPVVVKELALRDAAVEATLQRQLQQSFPGNLVSGTLSQHETIRMPLADVIANALDAEHPLAGEGEGTTITTDGVVEGRAAPKFVTAVFPGLNLARYQYEKMTGFSTYRADGSRTSDMIFNGRAYDLYMEGTTSAENLADYEVGLILLSPPQSPQFNHRFRPGRIPVLNVTGRIEDGQLHDVTVSYPLPNETLFTVFLKNNIFYRLWLEARRP